MTRIMLFSRTWKKYSYNIKPNQYPITENNVNVIYDTFIWLRDTFQKSWKYFNWKEWSKLVVGEGWETIEVIFKNICNTHIEPNYLTDPDFGWIDNKLVWPYIIYLPKSDIPSDRDLATQYWLLSYRVNKTWNFEIQHKCQLQNISWLQAIYSYVNYYAYNSETQTYENPNRIAVFHLEGNVLSDIDSITCLWFINKNLNVNDILVRRIEDENWNQLDWNYLQQYSNYLEINCTWLPLV